MRLKIFYAGLFFFFALALTAPAQEENCVRCHKKLIKGKVLHGALAANIGCRVCHAGIIAKYRPHKMSNTRDKGLMATLPDLCYSCHDKAMFTKKDVHAALGMGCTGCHNPHSTNTAKLLVSDQPGVCYTCHDKAKFTKKAVHAALGMGCTTCHNPHSTDRAKLLDSEQPDMCYTCHDKAKFTKKAVHAALGMGCTTCHNPHSTDRAKLLVSDQPGVCYSCHDKTMFTKKHVHAALGMGCTTCHTPHSSDEMALLVKNPVLVCLECHADAMNKPHMDISSSAAGHPLADTKKNWLRDVKLRNPAQPDKPFYCGSCHNPHSADTPKLFRFNAQSPKELCANCHKK
jgi:predicted CXXCH cytochrome family protein